MYPASAVLVTVRFAPPQIVLSTEAVSKVVPASPVIVAILVTFTQVPEGRAIERSTGKVFGDSEMSAVPTCTGSPPLKVSTTVTVLSVSLVKAIV